MDIARNQLSAPTKCDNCASLNIERCLNSVVYGMTRGDWPYCYFCRECRAMVGCHPNTFNPMGLMATPRIRRRRGQLHLLFDPIWQNKYMSRQDAYRWLAKELNLETDDCHIGQLTLDQLNKGLLIMSVHKATDYSQFKRRKVKNDTRRKATRTRNNDKIGRRREGRY